MEPINPAPNATPDQKDQKPLSQPNNPVDISINFTPTIGSAETAKPASTPQLLSLNVKKSELADVKVEPTPDQKEKKGLFGNLFNKKAATPVVTKPSPVWGESPDVTPALKPAINPQKEETKDFFNSSALSQKAGSNKLMESIAAQKSKLEEPKIEDLLGKKSTILEHSIEQEALFKLKRKLRAAQFISFAVALVAIVVNGFLYFQLSPGIDLMGYFQYNFDTNLRSDLFNLNENLRSVQTDLSKYQYLSGQLYLNQLGYESTRFMDAVNTLDASVTSLEKAVVQDVATQAKSRMPDLLAGAKNLLTQPIVVDTYLTRGEEAKDPINITLDFQNKLKAAILQEKTALQKASAGNDLTLPTSELAFFDNTLKLVGNRKLQDNLKASTVDAFKIEAEEFAANNDPAQRLAFRTFIENLLASTKVNLATITNLRNSRVKWSEVMARLEMITSQVNAEHNSGGGVGNGSLFTYSSYDFNSDTGAINVNAINTTRSGTNREVVTYLIEALESSPEFKNVSNRNFPLTKTKDAAGNETFTMNFKIGMELENGAFSKQNSPIADLQLNNAKVATLKIPVKR